MNQQARESFKYSHSEPLSRNFILKSVYPALFFSQQPISYQGMTAQELYDKDPAALMAFGEKRLDDTAYQLAGTTSKTLFGDPSYLQDALLYMQRCYSHLGYTRNTGENYGQHANRVFVRFVAYLGTLLTYSIIQNNKEYDFFNGALTNNEWLKASLMASLLLTPYHDMEENKAKKGFEYDFSLQRKEKKLIFDFRLKQESKMPYGQALEPMEIDLKDEVFAARVHSLFQSGLKALTKPSGLESMKGQHDYEDKKAETQIQQIATMKFPQDMLDKEVNIFESLIIGLKFSDRVENLSLLYKQSDEDNKPLKLVPAEPVSVRKQLIGTIKHFQALKNMLKAHIPSLALLAVDPIPLCVQLLQGQSSEACFYPMPILPQQEDAGGKYIPTLPISVSGSKMLDFVFAGYFGGISPCFLDEIHNAFRSLYTDLYGIPYLSNISAYLQKMLVDMNNEITDEHVTSLLRE